MLYFDTIKASKYVLAHHIPTLRDIILDLELYIKIFNEIRPFNEDSKLTINRDDLFSKHNKIEILFKNNLIKFKELIDISLKNSHDAKITLLEMYEKHKSLTPYSYGKTSLPTLIIINSQSSSKIPLVTSNASSKTKTGSTTDKKMQRPYHIKKITPYKPKKSNNSHLITEFNKTPHTPLHNTEDFSSCTASSSNHIDTTIDSSSVEELLSVPKKIKISSDYTGMEFNNEQYIDDSLIPLAPPTNPTNSFPDNTPHNFLITPHIDFFELISTERFEDYLVPIQTIKLPSRKIIHPESESQDNIANAR